MGLEDTILKFNQSCRKLEDVINSFINTYDNLEEKYNDVLKKLWSAKSDITLLQLNLQQLEKIQEKDKIIHTTLKEIIDRIDKLEEIIKNIESEFYK